MFIMSGKRRSPNGGPYDFNNELQVASAGSESTTWYV